MHQLFFLMRIYPYWAIPLALLFGQIAVYFRRRKSGLQFPLWGMIGLLIGTAAVWVFFRGDLHSDNWVRWLIS